MGGGGEVLTTLVATVSSVVPPGPTRNRPLVCDRLSVTFGILLISTPVLGWSHRTAFTGRWVPRGEGTWGGGGGGANILNITLISLYYTYCN